MDVAQDIIQCLTSTDHQSSSLETLMKYRKKFRNHTMMKKVLNLGKMSSLQINCMKVQNSILCGRFADPQGRLGDLCLIQETP